MTGSSPLQRSIIMPIAEPESHSRTRESRSVEPSPAKDSVHELVDTLREEFGRGLVREAAQMEAEGRRRTTIRIVILLAAAGAILAATIVRKAIHLPH
jgi:hypothetical protein